MRNIFICPVCKRELEDCVSLYRCSHNHCFDKSKFGYVNLLQSQKSNEKRHGDDRLMIRARRDFLSQGHYSFLCEELSLICFELLNNGALILDAGCGECYYSAGIKNYSQSNGKTFDFAGVDISKDALEFASKRKSGVVTAVASLFDLPLQNESCNALLNVFSPEADDEFRRVIKNGGYLIRVIPLEKHLFELKEMIYDKPYLNTVASPELDGFTLINEIKLCRILELTSALDIENLFKMTPYYYKTGRTDQEKLAQINYLKTWAEFGIRIYRKDD